MASATRLLPEGHSNGAGPQLAVRTPERFTLVVMGRSRVGKTALTICYTSAAFVQQYDPTIEDKHLKHTTIGNAPVSLEILDTAGEENYSALRRSWMQHGGGESGFLFVFSLVDRQTFDELVAFHDELMDLYQDDPPPSVLVANKSDIDAGEWVVTDEEVKGLRSRWRNCTQVIYTSASSGSNVAEAFEPLCVAVRERVHRRRRAAREREAERNALLRENSTGSTCGRCRFAHCIRDRCAVS